MKMEFKLTKKEKIILLQIARLSLETKLLNKKVKFPDPTDTLIGKHGAFVSLHIMGSLRGCIGYIQPLKPLVDTVKEMAQSAAFSDPRFPPLTKNELEKIDIEISVLSPLKKIHKIEEIEVGVHGLVVKSGLYSGLLLPQVATQYGWDREEFLYHTCQKAGLPGNFWKLADIELQIFSAIVFGEHELGLK